MIKVTIKWGKEQFSNVEFDLTKPLEDFKASIYKLTKVPIEKQKILAKGSVIKVKLLNFPLI